MTIIWETETVTFREIIQKIISSETETVIFRSIFSVGNLFDTHNQGGRKWTERPCPAELPEASKEVDAGGGGWFESKIVGVGVIGGGGVGGGEGCGGVSVRRWGG